MNSAILKMARAEFSDGFDLESMRNTAVKGNSKILARASGRIELSY